MPAGTAVWKQVVPGGAESVWCGGTEAPDAADLGSAIRVSLLDLVSGIWCSSELLLITFGDSMNR